MHVLETQTHLCCPHLFSRFEPSAEHQIPPQPLTPTSCGAPFLWLPLPLAPPTCAPAQHLARRPDPVVARVASPGMQRVGLVVQRPQQTPHRLVRRRRQEPATGGGVVSHVPSHARSHHSQTHACMHANTRMHAHTETHTHLLLEKQRAQYLFELKTHPGTDSVIAHHTTLKHAHTCTHEHTCTSASLGPATHSHSQVQTCTHSRTLTF